MLVCNNSFVENEVFKIRHHCNVTEKYNGDAHRDCYISVSLNCEIPIVFHNLKNYHAHFITQELGKFDFKINVIPNGLEKYTKFSLNSKLLFFDSFKFISSSLNSLVKYLGENDFKRSSQEFESEVLDLTKKKNFIALNICAILKTLMKH